MITFKQLLFVSGLLLGTFHACWGQANEVSNPEVLKKICSGSCSGFGAGITFLADKRGAVKYYRFDGSIKDCSHPPSTLYDLKGNVIDVMGSNPVDPKNPVQAKKITRWQGLQKNLTVSKTIGCGDISQ